MERKLITNGFYINFVLTEKLKGVELDGFISISHTFKRCGTKKEGGDKIFFFVDDEDLLKITFCRHEEEILIFRNRENACFILRHQVGKNNFNKIKKFFSEVEKEINEK